MRDEMEGRADARGTAAVLVVQAAHDLLCWTYQHEIAVEPGRYTRKVTDLNPEVYASMNAAERVLYDALRTYEVANNGAR